MSTRIAALATHVGPHRTLQGAAIDPSRDELAMAVKVAREAIRGATMEVDELDYILFAPCGIRQIFPGGAAAIAEALGTTCGSFDVTAGCASMGIAVEIGGRMPGTSLVVSADSLSRTIDPDDPSHAPLRSCADGAAAMVLRHDQGQGPRILAHRARTVGRWRRFYGVRDGRLLRSLPQDKQKELRDDYLRSWTEIGCELLRVNRSATETWIYANQGDTHLFADLAHALGLPEDRLVRTSHGHAGGSDPWIGLKSNPPPTGALALLLTSGIGFVFHGTLLEMA